MHWLEKWRRDFQRKDGGTGIGRDELAKMIHKPGTYANPASEINCSAVLIAILEGGGITHPEIANRIADITGATAQQRDMLVHEIHRGTYVPGAKENRTKSGKRPAPTDPGYKPANAREVVRIDIFGRTERYASVLDAAHAAGCSAGTVQTRCRRALSAKTNEFLIRDHTWRYADEWEAMTPEAQMDDLRSAGLCK
jgi:hypothetical protein